MIAPFAVPSLPCIVIGEGTLTQVSIQAAPFGKRTLIITGALSFRDSLHWESLTSSLHAQGISRVEVSVEGKPSPQLVDDAVAAWRDNQIDVVV